MNIFVLDHDARKAAQAHCDKHVVKMCLETAQLLCSPFPPGDAPYRRTHYNHPCAVWARTSEANYEWLLDFGEYLFEEYTYRYCKMHGSKPAWDWCLYHYDRLEFPEIGRTPFPQCMPEQYHRDDPVKAYRRYYLLEKVRIARWDKNRPPPDWWHWFLLNNRDNKAVRY